MMHRMAGFAIAACCVAALFGCMAGGGSEMTPSPPGYAPYDPETNPYCGITSTCEPVDGPRRGTLRPTYG